LRQQLKPCPKEPAGHKMATRLHECPWCRIMVAGGPNYFEGVAAVGAVFLFDQPRLATLAQRTAQVSGRSWSYSRPHPPSRPPEPEPVPEEVQSSRTLLWIVTVIAVLGPLLLLGGFCFKPLALFGLGVVAVFGTWSLVLFYTSAFAQEFDHRRKALAAAQDSLLDAEDEMARLAAHNRDQGDRLLVQVGRLRQSWEALPGGYQAEYHELERNREALARDHFLRSRLLADHPIPKIGPSRKQVLASFGIESAFDIGRARILAIKGFGEVLADNLVQWRQEVLAEFRFDPASGVPKAEAQAVALKYKQQQDSLRLRLEQDVKSLEILVSRADQDWRPTFGRIRQLVAALAQAKADLAALTRLLGG
jgi:DNA-binding helix-hairpin-helix protein with protein kinase domain